MTDGEKILFYRKQCGLTQKRLAELSGVSEISIRKYELGSRNPKPAQLKKLAKAMKMAENTFFDIEVSDVTLETDGDFMAILFQFIEKMNCRLEYEVDTEGNFLENSVKISLNNPIIQQAFVTMYKYFDTLKDCRDEFTNSSHTDDQLETFKLSQLHLKEITKRSLFALDTPLVTSDSTDKKQIPDFEEIFIQKPDK
ncbi:MAG: helix-turn-helix transcriptional regulator [Eubacteriales bacterium]